MGSLRRGTYPLEKAVEEKKLVDDGLSEEDAEKDLINNPVAIERVVERQLSFFGERSWLASTRSTSSSMKFVKP